MWFAQFQYVVVYYLSLPFSFSFSFFDASNHVFQFDDVNELQKTIPQTIRNIKEGAEQILTEIWSKNQKQIRWLQSNNEKKNVRYIRRHRRRCFCCSLFCSCFFF